MTNLIYLAAIKHMNLSGYIQMIFDINSISNILDSRLAATAAYEGVRRDSKKLMKV
jgi:hypothetical protein